MITILLKNSKRISFCFLILFILAICKVSFALDYNIEVSIKNQNTIHVNCVMKFDTIEDSFPMEFSFGGSNFFTIQQLRFRNNDGAVTHKKKTLTISKKTEKIEFSYNYFSMVGMLWKNKANFFGWGNDKWYPYSDKFKYNIKIHFELPSEYLPFTDYSLTVNKKNDSICEYLLIESSVLKDVSFMWITNSMYEENICPGNIAVTNYIENDSLYDAIDFKQQSKDLNNAVKYFHSITGYKYPYNSINIIQIEWKLRGNTIFGNNVIADLTSFTPKSEVIVHEIGHKWFNNYLSFSEGKGKVFLNESMNEYFVLMYLRKSYGDSIYYDKLEKYKKSFLEKANKKILKLSLYKLKEFRSMYAWATYRKGPFLIGRFVDRIGYEKWESFVKTLFKEYAAMNKPLSYENYIDMLKRYSSEDDIEWFDKAIKSTKNFGMDI